MTTIWKTAITKKLGLKYPIIQAPMAGGATTPELVAAVSNSGGLGSLGAGYMSPKDIRLAIQKIRQLTDKPFAVNLFIPEAHSASAEQMQKACEAIHQCCSKFNLQIEPPSVPYTESFEEQVNILMEEKIPVFSFTFGILEPKWITPFKANHTLLIGTATTLAEAKVLQNSGVDMVVAQSSEAGGHRGTFIGKAEDALIKLIDLVAQLVDAIDVPVIAAGGVMNGQDIIQAIRAGASAVQMGTAFLSCPESGVHPEYKKALLTQRQDSTTLTRAFSGKLARGIRNSFINCMENKKNAILDYPIQNALTSNFRKKAYENGNIEFMSLWAGQSVHLSRGVSVNKLMEQVIFEAEAPLSD